MRRGKGRRGIEVSGNVQGEHSNNLRYARVRKSRAVCLSRSISSRCTSVEIQGALDSTPREHHAAHTCTQAGYWKERSREVLQTPVVPSHRPPVSYSAQDAIHVPVQLNTRSRHDGGGRRSIPCILASFISEANVDENRKTRRRLKSKARSPLKLTCR